MLRQRLAQREVPVASAVDEGLERVPNRVILSMQLVDDSRRVDDVESL